MTRLMCITWRLPQWLQPSPTQRESHPSSLYRWYRNSVLIILMIFSCFCFFTVCQSFSSKNLCCRKWYLFYIVLFRALVCVHHRIPVWVWLVMTRPSGCLICPQRSVFASSRPTATGRSSCITKCSVWCYLLLDLSAAWNSVFVLFCRVKSLEGFTVDDFYVVVTASNDGFIKLWKLQMEKVTSLIFFFFTSVIFRSQIPIWYCSLV